MPKSKRKIVAWFTGCGGLILLSLFGWIGPWPVNKLLYMVFGGLAFFFAPGFLLSYLVFPRFDLATNRATAPGHLTLDLFERIIVGLLFSMALVAIIFTIMRRLNVILTPELIGWAVYGITSVIALSLVWFRLKSLKKNK